MKLISLIGEQPIPILLAAKHLKPDKNVLVHTRRTKNVADRLQQFLNNCSFLEADPYQLESLYRLLSENIDTSEECVFNLTGGTKMMALATYALASETGHAFIYLDSESRQNILYQYNFSEGKPTAPERTVLPPYLTIDDYLKSHLPGYKIEGPDKEGGELSAGGMFEQTIGEKLQESELIDEVMLNVKPEAVDDNIEIDLVVRKGNQVGIIEAKTGTGGKEGIDQLTTAGSRKYLGTYTHRFYVIGKQSEDERWRAVAKENNILVIPLQDYKVNVNKEGKTKGWLGINSTNRLVNWIDEKMSPPKR